ncbi:MBL fold metallo-hydrolase [Streptomyces mashuensis]|uniref:MBL fold metallo-hydrolase n=1 Tax=Streptomyces mashuensis TaxID=33904 RepID=A0A919EEP5_9ACTN|nr:MBL fold metallo-hydrolase [Streptomyces mashuensis]
MGVDEVTPGIWMLTFAAGQAYVLRRAHGWMLVDTGLPAHAGDVLDALAGLGAGPRDVRDIVLTHSHLDHAGSAADLADATGARVLAGAADAPVIRGDVPEPPPVLEEWEVPLYEEVHARIGIPPRTPVRPCRVDRELGEGDVLDWDEEVRVVEVPGHTAGSIALHLTRSGVLFTGDTIANMGGISPSVFHVDRPRAVASFLRQATLHVDTACFGHGAPLVGGAGEALREAAAALGGPTPAG